MLLSGVICESVGGHTGYDPDNFIDGGDLDDED